MAEDIVQNLDLEKILATLASLPKSENQAYQEQAHTYQNGQSYDGSEQLQHTQTPQEPLPYHQSTDPRINSRPAQSRQQPPPRPQERSSTPLVDPSTITEWKQGLRCVSKIAAQNSDFAPAVRKLMKDQEQNVKSWETGRTRLFEDHKLKRDNEQLHRAALSLPGLLEGTPLLRTPEREKEELDQYDAKVYRACKAMVESQALSLKVLGVPFFGTKPYLIGSTTKETTDALESEPIQTGGGKITKEELVELQRKMLNHLMELYGD